MKRVLAFLMLAGGAAAYAQGIVPWVERKKERPDLLKKIEFDQKLNAQVPLGLLFRDESGRTLPLAAYFGKKPVVLSLAYYECPMLCTLALNGQLRAYRALSFEIGRDFEVVTVSINPKEGPTLAAAKKASYLDKYRRPGAERGWHFLTGTEESIQALAAAVGFHYAYDPASQQYAHATGLMVLTPEGRISRYQYGVEYSANDLREAIIGASARKVGSPVEKVLLYCFHYDPSTGKYSLAVLNLVRAGAIATFVGLFTFIVVASMRRRRVRA
ncbi:MAG TPA: SCO family protein [Bryobacteraceae bacterium]|nr:SCO family protein [Bryobacteraceae bacterium]